MSDSFGSRDKMAKHAMQLAGVMSMERLSSAPRSTEHRAPSERPINPHAMQTHPSAKSSCCSVLDPSYRDARRLFHPCYPAHSNIHKPSRTILTIPLLSPPDSVTDSSSTAAAVCAEDPSGPLVDGTCQQKQNVRWQSRNSRHCGFSRFELPTFHLHTYHLIQSWAHSPRSLLQTTPSCQP